MTAVRRAGDTRHRLVLPMDFDVEPSVLTHFRRSQCEFWRSFYDAQSADGSPTHAADAVASGGRLRTGR